MRFMMFMTIKDQDPAAWSPTPDDVAAMMAYNEELTKAGVLLALDGLQPTSEGARIRWDSGSPVATDGPFAESKEVVGGYWIIDVKDKAEAIEWASRCPVEGDDCFVEVRRVFEMSDFPQDVQDAAGELSVPPPEQTTAR